MFYDANSAQNISKMHSKLLFEFFIIFGRITTYNSMQINTINPNYAYYKIVQLELRYEYSITLILHKT
jgi:hypothetical protein